jgi:molybdenum cofactor cytidylyltransferase
LKFGPVAVSDAIGGIVAHAIRQPGLTLRKGDRLGQPQIALLREAGVDTVTIAQLEPGDVGEDEAALRLAQAVAGDHVRVDKPFTGRANLFAETAGILLADAQAIDRINTRDERITLATLPPMRRVVEGEMIGTVKIIPFAVPEDALAQAIAAANGFKIGVAPFRGMRVGVVSTLLPGLKPSTVAKTLRILRERLAHSGASLGGDREVPHETQALAQAIDEVEPDSDLVIVFGASAITDRRDVIPAAIESAGGAIEQFGMPVDPGNLLLLGRTRSGKTVLGAPGCARSPKENGFDWVLDRLLADVPVTAQDIRRLGAGGLLMEIVSRPQPRGGEAPRPEPDNGDE